jgi:hypothetical protein
LKLRLMPSRLQLEFRSWTLFSCIRQTRFCLTVGLRWMLGRLPTVTGTRPYPRRRNSRQQESSQRVQRRS